MIPRHIGIIPDGNRRWARARGLPIWKGHERGADLLEEITEVVFRSGVDHLTFYVFSLKNFQRSYLEKRAIFRILKKKLPVLKEKAEGYGARVILPGRPDLFPNDLREMMRKVEAESSGKRSYILLLGYDGIDEIKRAAVKFAEAYRQDSSVRFEDFLDIPPSVPPMDLIIRTSGEKRVSGFPLFHVSYAELYFVDKYWPDFTADDLFRAMDDYEKRERRFGK